jgi:hypothetical protein
MMVSRKLNRRADLEKMKIWKAPKAEKLSL